MYRTFILDGRLLSSFHCVPKKNIQNTNVSFVSLCGNLEAHGLTEKNSQSAEFSLIRVIAKLRTFKTHAAILRWRYHKPQ